MQNCLRTARAEFEASTHLRELLVGYMDQDASSCQGASPSRILGSSCRHISISEASLEWLHRLPSAALDPRRGD